MQEIWEVWKPDSDIVKKYNLENISDDIENFHMIFSEDKDPEKKIKLIFENFMFSYRSTYESNRTKLFCDLHDKYGDGFFGTKTFFIVRQSEYIAWLKEQSSGILDDEVNEIVHFSILAADHVVDVISYDEPIWEVC